MSADNAKHRLITVDPSNFDAVEMAIKEAKGRIKISQAKYTATVDTQRQIEACIRRFRHYKDELTVKVRGPYTVTTLMELETQLMHCIQRVRLRCAKHKSNVEENRKLIESYKEILALRPSDKLDKKNARQ